MKFDKKDIDKLVHLLKTNPTFKAAQLYHFAVPDFMHWLCRSQWQGVIEISTCTQLVELCGAISQNGGITLQPVIVNSNITGFTLQVSEPS